MTIDRVIERMRNHPQIRTGEGASEDEIVAAEHALGAFPSDYRIFLAQLGWAELATNRLYGLGPGLDPAENVVEGSRSIRRYESVEEWPEHFAYLADMGTGDGWILLLDPEDDGSFPVYFADVHLGEFVHQADSFTQWLSRILDDPELLLSSGGNH